MTPDPIEELRKCLSEPRFTTSKAITDALAAYDAKCAEVERLRDELVHQTRRASTFAKKVDELYAQIDTANAHIESISERLREAEEKVE